MRVLHLLAISTLAMCLASPPVAWAAERVPPALAAKRAGKTPPPPATPSPQELLYVPIAPCRVISDVVPKQVTTAYQISGSGNFVPQGGPAGGCGVPSAARAVTMNVATQPISNAGYLTANAGGNPALTMYYEPGKIESENATLPLTDAGQMYFYSRWSAAMNADVTGYYVPQLWAYISSSGAIIDSSNRVVSSENTATGNYTVTFNRDIGYCSGTASSDLSGYIISVYTSGTLAYVYVYNNAGAASNYWFNLHISC